MHYIAYGGFFRDFPVKIRELDGTYTDATVLDIIVEDHQPETMIVEQDGVRRQIWLGQACHPEE